MMLTIPDDYPDYMKLKKNLRLAIHRLQLIEKKKIKRIQNARKEIADCLAANNIDTARSKAEHTIREDQLIEVMEMIEVYCDLLITHFGLISHLTAIDESTAEAIFTLVWVAPRLQDAIPELSVISVELVHKYGQSFAKCARTAIGNQRVSKTLMNMLKMNTPPKYVVEKYLIAIAESYNVLYEPEVVQDDPKPSGEEKENTIDLLNLDGSTSPPDSAFREYPEMPSLPDDPEEYIIKPSFHPPLSPQYTSQEPGFGGYFWAKNMFFHTAPVPIRYDLSPELLESSPLEREYREFMLRRKANNNLSRVGNPDEDNLGEASNKLPIVERSEKASPTKNSYENLPYLYICRDPQPSSLELEGKPICASSDLPGEKKDAAESDEDIDFFGMLARFDDLDT